MQSLTDLSFREAIAGVNERGFAALRLGEEVMAQVGEPLYLAMDRVTLHPNRNGYYNEIAFHWKEDWSDVEGGLLAFHEEKSLKHIFTAEAAENLLRTEIGPDLTRGVMSFASRIRTLVTRNHFGLIDNDLRLARVMVRQMGESDSTRHGGSDWHEDVGYSGRPYEQLLSVIATTWGKPTEAHRYQPQVGELLFFNATDRRRRLGLSDELAFIHRGPKSGPKLFFFFEFLGKRPS